MQEKALEKGKFTDLMLKYWAECHIDFSTMLAKASRHREDQVSDSLCIAASRCLSLPLAASHCLSLPLTASRCLSLHLAASHCLSLPLTAHCLAQSGCMFLHVSAHCLAHFLCTLTRFLWLQAASEKKLTGLDPDIRRTDSDIIQEGNPVLFCPMIFNTMDVDR